MVVDTRRRASWTPEALEEHSQRCQALAVVGSLRRRCAGLEPPPPVDIRIRREVPVSLNVPAGYMVLWRRENVNDIGIYRACGPNGWTRDFVTMTLAEEACRECADGAAAWVAAAEEED